MVTTNLISEEDEEAARTLVLYSEASGEIFKEVTTSTLTPEEEEEAKREAVVAMIQLSQTKTHPIQRRKRMKADKSQPEEVEIADQAMQRQHMEKDDSEETLTMLLNWNSITPEKPSLLHHFMGDVCSKTMRKQVMGSDVKEDQCRLMLRKSLVKKMMEQVMGNSEKVGTDGLEVSVYGRDGEVCKMMFKMWGVGTPVLAGKGWNQFVKDYGLTKHSDFLTVWMFKHRVTDEICFAVDKTTFPMITMALSSKTSKAVFQNLN